MDLAHDATGAIIHGPHRLELAHRARVVRANRDRRPLRVYRGQRRLSHPDGRLVRHVPADGCRRHYRPIRERDDILAFTAKVSGASSNLHMGTWASHGSRTGEAFPFLQKNKNTLPKNKEWLAKERERNKNGQKGRVPIRHHRFRFQKKFRFQKSWAKSTCPERCASHQSQRQKSNLCHLI